jgi:hypothetical protein
MVSTPGYEHNIFISYSHLDEVWKDCVVKHLGVAQKQGLLNTWDDRKLAGGDDWFNEITHAIERGSIAVLLISVNSLTSDFICGNCHESSLTAKTSRAIDEVLAHPDQHTVRREFNVATLAA